MQIFIPEQLPLKFKKRKSIKTLSLFGRMRLHSPRSKENMKRITSEERHTIACLLKQNKKPNQIAKALDRSPSTITREIKRNSDQRSGEYRYELAQRKAKKRQQTKASRKDLNPEIQQRINALLEKKYSPEQIVGVCKRRNQAMVSHETIYKYIWNDKKNQGELHTHLRTQGKRYRKRGAAKDNRGIIKNRKPLSARPPEIENRERLGDLEIDLIIGKGHKGALLTINDRASGLLIIEKLESKNASEVSQKTIDRLEPFKDQLHTITSDNGKEFAGHELISKALGIDFYFAKPYHSWERGSNENLNGLVRQYIPKNTNIMELDPGYIHTVQTHLNQRPRKRYNYQSPLSIHQQLTKKQKVALAS